MDVFPGEHVEKRNLNVRCHAIQIFICTSVGRLRKAGKRLYWEQISWSQSQAKRKKKEASQKCTIDAWETVGKRVRLRKISIYMLVSLIVSPSLVSSNNGPSSSWLILLRSSEQRLHFYCRL